MVGPAYHTPYLFPCIKKKTTNLVAFTLFGFNFVRLISFWFQGNQIVHNLH